MKLQEMLNEVESESFNHSMIMKKGGSLIDNVKKSAQENGGSIRFITYVGVKHKYAKNDTPSFRMSSAYQN